MRIAIAQHNVLLGDFEHIDALILRCADRAQDHDVDILIFPELFLVGGPAADLITRPEILSGCARRLDSLAKRTEEGPAILIGYPQSHNAPHGTGIYNAAALLRGGRVECTYQQQAVADTGVNNARRWFDPGAIAAPFSLDGQRVQVAIGNDLWNETGLANRPALIPSPGMSAARPGDILIHLDADSWCVGRRDERLHTLRTIARESQRPIVYAHAVGTTQSRIYDGGSMVLSANGHIHHALPAFEDAVWFGDVPVRASLTSANDAPSPTWPDVEDEVFDALVYGVRDNVHKSGFSQVTFGLSGGIDSALVAAIATEALGPENVFGVALPSQYSSDHSLRDARALAENLDMPYDEISIESTYQALVKALAPSFAGTSPGVAEENLQARARGVILMGLANKFSRLVLATSNKSEFAVGYSTLYGDMCGAFSPLSDVPKQMVYALSRTFNARRGFDAIPQSTLTKPPSAELRPGQVDQDSLPDYAIVDDIVDRYLVQRQSAADIVQAGLAAADVRRVLGLLHGSGYKRQQAAPGLQISRRPLEIGRQFPAICDFSALNLP